MGRIVIKDKQTGKDRNKQIWELLGQNNIHPWKVNDNKNSFIVIVKDEDIERVIAEHVRNKFKDKGFEITVPPEYNSKRTILIKGIDKHFDNIEERKIKESIETRYSHLKVEQVVKLKNDNFRAFKLKLSTIEMAKKIKEQGIIIGNQSFPDHQIEEEIFVALVPCYNCYKYNHKTRECPIEKQTICTNCSQKDHTYKECKNPPKCINCQQAHSTLQAKCKIRKDLIKEGIKKIKQNQQHNSNMSYAQVTANTRQQQQQNQQQQSVQENLITNLPQNAATTIMTALIAGHIQEAIRPGSFQRTVDQVYRLNGLPRVILPNNWDHLEILSHLGIDSKQIEKKRKEIQETNKEKSEEGQKVYLGEKDSDAETNKNPIAMEESDLDIVDTSETEREIDALYSETKKKVKDRKRKTTLSPTLQQLNKEKRATHYTSHESLSEEINLHELKLCIYVLNGNKINLRCKSDRIRVIDAYIEGHLKATWEKQEWTRENIKTLLDTNKNRVAEYIKIRKVDKIEYDNIRDGYTTS